MNEFSEMEEQLRKLRPMPPSDRLVSRLEAALEEEEASAKIVRAERFRLNWAYIGLGLAAAAMLLVFVQVNVARHHSPRQIASAAASPVPAAALPAVPASQFIRADATQVVYNVRDEGLVFPEGSIAPVRKVRSQTRESLQWRNPKTGASLVVSYPAEQVRFIPVSGQ